MVEKQLQKIATRRMIPKASRKFKVANSLGYYFLFFFFLQSFGFHGTRGNLFFFIRAK
jgi:hypothetical protein